MVGTRAFLSQITIVLQIGFHGWTDVSICCGCSRLLSQFLNCEEMHMEDLPVPVTTARQLFVVIGIFEQPEQRTNDLSVLRESRLCLACS
jgi:hypothetical protein